MIDEIRTRTLQVHNLLPLPLGYNHHIQLLRQPPRNRTSTSRVQGGYTTTIPEAEKCLPNSCHYAVSFGDSGLETLNDYYNPLFAVTLLSFFVTVVGFEPTIFRI